jgi:hypothetical protein
MEIRHSERFRRLFFEICEQAVEDDGLTFMANTVAAERIKDDEDYEGVRVLLQARLGVTRISLQVDIGFGDVITPAPIEVEYPTMLGLPAPKLRAYPRETVVAEKFEAMVKLGMANSRMKDFYDLWELSRRFDFEGSTLMAAIQATFQRRATAFPLGTPLSLSSEFYDAPSKRTQWTAFLRKSGLRSETLGEVVAHISTFLLPVISAIQKVEPFDLRWTAGGTWEEK